MIFGYSIDQDNLPHYLDVALTVVVMAQTGLYISELGGGLLFAVDSVAEKIIFPFLLVLLLCIVIAKYVARTRRSNNLRMSRIQRDAILSLSDTIRHRLNNDMQVVLGNAELAQILINNEGNLMKPLQNIAEAADDAIERIEALAVVGSTGTTEPDLIDLNAVLRESTARLVSEIPSTVKLKLELEQLSSRVTANRFLLGLGFTHLVTQASDILRGGVDIAIKSTDVPANDTDRQARVLVEVCMLYASISSVDADDIRALEDCLVTTKVLIERAWARNVRLFFSNDGCQMSFRFTKEGNNPESRGRLLDQSIRTPYEYTV